MPRVNAAMSQVWQQDGAPWPPAIWLRPGSSWSPGTSPAGAPRLISSKGVALRFYPRKANGRDRDYGAFLLMKETGRGSVPTPDYYTPGPALVRRGGR
jgi:hypothetical protein